MVWNIVLQFPNAQSIEKQKIELVFDITKELIDGNISLSIQHTNPAWGNEVLNLFKEHIDQLIRSPRKGIRRVNQIVGSNRRDHFKTMFFIPIIVSLFLLAAFTGGLGLNEKQYDSKKHQLVEQIYKLSKEGKLDEVQVLTTLFTIDNASMSDLSKLSKSGRMPKITQKPIGEYLRQNKLKKIDYAVLLLAIIGGPILFYIYYVYYINAYITYFLDASFILITKRAEINRVALTEVNRGHKFYGITFILFSVLVGLIATGIFYIIQKFAAL